MSTQKEISEVRVRAFVLLIERKKITLSDIKDVDYRKAVEIALNSK